MDWLCEKKSVSNVQLHQQVFSALLSSFLHALTSVLHALICCTTTIHVKAQHCYAQRVCEVIS